MFNGLKRSGQQVILGIREQSDNDGYRPHEVLAATADFLETLAEHVEITAAPTISIGLPK